MSTLDIFVEKGKKIGFEKGIEEGIEQGLEKGKVDFVTNLLLNTDFPVSQIAKLANVSEDFVSHIYQEINTKSK